MRLLFYSKYRYGLLRAHLLWPLLLLLFLAGIASIVFWALSWRALPQGKSGAQAEALTKRIEQAVNLTAWRRTAAVSFRFARRDTRHFRDNFRGYREVSWTSGERQYKVQYDAKKTRYIAFQNGQRINNGAQAQELYREARERHTNDFFWLHPFSQLRAPGAERQYLSARALLVRYTRGGITPGDSYLIISDANFRPIRWQMWVSILPFKGYEFSFEEWHDCQTGARFSLQHRSLLLDVPIRDVRCYARYPMPGAVDRFAALIK